MPAYVALLRGINVGGQNLLKMEPVRASFASLGFTRVRSLLASGNVVFHAPKQSSRKLEVVIERRLARDHGFGDRVVVRSAAEYARMMKAMPARWGSDPASRYYVLFLRHTVDPAAVLEQVEVNPAVEQVRYVPGALLWSAKIAGLTRSKVRKLLASKLYAELTVRNLNTTRKLMKDLSAEDSRSAS